MRRCAKDRCSARPAATVALHYEDRTIEVRGLEQERDPNLLDLCEDHLARLTPPIGWSVHDGRAKAAATS
jgi:uncharacterized protein DUF3499